MSRKSPEDQARDIWLGFLVAAILVILIGLAVSCVPARTSATDRQDRADFENSVYDIRHPIGSPGCSCRRR